MNEHEKAIIDYLKMMKSCVKSNTRKSDFVYYGSGDLLLQHGKFYKPPEVVEIKLTPKACFANCQFFSSSEKRRKLKYVEGYALSIIPVHHAWCADEDDNVVECTWTEPGRAYYGIEFKPPKKFVGSMMDNGRDFDIYLRNWRETQ
jgi:hypothetical protein